jgi:hypothetical protein
VDVDVVGVEREQVAGGPGLDGQAGAAQPGDQGLQGVRGLGGWFVTPDAVDEPAGGDDPAGVEREDDQERAQARAGDRHGGSVVGPHTEGAEHRDTHAGDSAPWRGRGRLTP